jgi:hypothetical protein
MAWRLAPAPTLGLWRPLTAQGLWSSAAIWRGDLGTGDQRAGDLQLDHGQVERESVASGEHTESAWRPRPGKPGACPMATQPTYWLDSWPESTWIPRIATRPNPTPSRASRV